MEETNPNEDDMHAIGGGGSVAASWFNAIAALIRIERSVAVAHDDDDVLVGLLLFASRMCARASASKNAKLLLLVLL